MINLKISKKGSLEVRKISWGQRLNIANTKRLVQSDSKRTSTPFKTTTKTETDYETVTRIIFLMLKLNSSLKTYNAFLDVVQVPCYILTHIPMFSVDHFICFLSYLNTVLQLSQASLHIVILLLSNVLIFLCTLSKYSSIYTLHILFLSFLKKRLTFLHMQVHEDIGSTFC